MTTPPGPPTPEDRVRARAQAALRLVCAAMPHLVGLTRVVRIVADRRFPTAAISQAGRLYVNPDWFARLDASEATFIAAHELLHLCLQTHERGVGSDGELFNWAHDYIINDMLVHELGRSVPRGGLACDGVRHLSAERVMMLLRQGRLPGPRPGAKPAMTRALEEAGLIPPRPPDLGPGSGDVLSPEMERRLFPDLDPAEQECDRQHIRRVAARCNSLRLVQRRLDAMPGAPAAPGASTRTEPADAVAEALRAAYCPPWELALQQWIEAIAPGPRSYARPSRRGADRTDVALPGRRREGWALHLVLDTSGSMADEIPRLLGVIASFCEAANVAAIHVLQCDDRVTRDEWLDPGELARYTISGFGGSDMTPALLRLADDPQVEAALVLTDGYIDYPATPLPFQVLWVLTGAPPDGFSPDYGRCIRLPAPAKPPG